MEVINKIKIDLLRPGVKPMINAMQADENSRILEITLSANGSAWEVPEGATFSMAYKKPDGTRGLYDTLPDGSSASSVDQNVVSIRLAPQMLTTPGNVNASVVISNGDQRISTFPVFVNVIQNPAVGAVGSEDYFYSSVIGKLDDLNTTDKSSIVAAINEAAQSCGGSGAPGADGEDGATFTPYVSTDGTLSWTNDKGLENPKAVNVKGPQGPAGSDYVITDADKDEIAAKVPIVKVAEQPTFVNDISECTDTSKVYVLPNGHLAAYMTQEVTTDGSAVPNFTNIFNTANGAYIKDGYRYSQSGGAFSEEAATCAVVIPVISSTNRDITFRLKGATNAVTTRLRLVYFGETNTSFGSAGGDVSTLNGSVSATGDLITIKMTTSASEAFNTAKYAVLHVDAGSVKESELIVTQDEEITYTTIDGGTEIIAAWTDTGIEYNQPADYSDRVAAVEKKTAQLEIDVDALEDKLMASTIGTAETTAFSVPAYAPYPQSPGDGSEDADFDVNHVPTADAYAYMDALVNKYRTYIVKQNLGKDTTGEYDYFRYVFSKAYWRAWYKENYPKMYAWINGETVCYSESVSPRVGDMMYSTGYIGTGYGAVAAVNCSTVGVASTRTVNGLEFTRYTDGDIEPTIVYTKPMALYNGAKGYIWTSGFSFYKSIATFTHEYIVDSAGDKYYRYPFEDRKLDKTKPLSVFVLANEHGNNGDSLMPSVTVMRMLKDLCQNTGNDFMAWMKENVVLTVIPVGNPWGYDRDPSTSEGGYFNGNGVNINRNYDTPGWAGSSQDYGGMETFGEYAGSENENQYIMNTIQQCKADVGLSFHGISYVADKHGTGEYNGNAVWEGCGFDQSRIWKVSEALFSQYGFGFSPNTGDIIDDSDNDYNHCGKSQAYIEYCGAVGGLIESIDWEIGSANNYTAVAMEQAYSELLLVLQNWIEEALLKASS